MSFDRLSEIFTALKVDDNLQELKEHIRQSAHELRNETVRFIEQHAECALRQEDPPAPRLPIFYTKGFNWLKSVSNANHFKCPILELVPFAVECCWLSEHGKSPEMPKLVRMEDGCLKFEDPRMEVEDVHYIVDDLFNDAEEYFFNYLAIEGKCPEVPRFVELMRRFLKNRFPEEDFETIGKKLNNYLTSTFGEEHLPEDYFEQNGCH